MYIHELKTWPKFQWDREKVTPLLAHVRHQQGRLIGGMEAIGFQLREEVVLQTLTQDVVKSSEIEGEVLDQALVRSSVARHLGIEIAALPVLDRNVEGVVAMMLDATQKFDQPITGERLFGWHSSLFPSGRSHFAKIRVGAWRAGPVQVVSGPLGREKVHFEGPSGEKVGQAMAEFIDWLNRDAGMDLVLKAAVAHLWFVTVHPFDDGNGRIGRAIADLMLARSERCSERFYSMSAQIQVERSDYYAILEKTQKGSLDITAWIEWFLDCLCRAIEKSLTALERIQHKAKIWDMLGEASLNDRQRKLINLLLDGFIGKLTSSKWAKIAKCSQDTAYRDILELIDQRILIKNADQGRNTSYSLVERMKPPQF